MNCPICEKDMTPGKVFLEKSSGHAFLWGLGTRELYFQDDGGKKWREMSAWSTCAAFKCHGCGAFLVAGKSRNE